MICGSTVDALQGMESLQCFQEILLSGNVKDILEI